MSQAAIPSTSAAAGPKMVTLTIDGKPVTVAEGTTVWEAALSVGIEIPVLCHKPNMNPVGVCRVCAVDTGARVYSSACTRTVEPNMNVVTGAGDEAQLDEKGKKIRRARKTLVELLLAEHPSPCKRQAEHGDCELEVLAEKLGVKEPVFTPRAFSKGTDLSNPSIHIDHSACILCDRCVRACTDVKHNNVIGRMGKGYYAAISFDDNKPMGDSSCVNCGECMISCPTGAITAGPLVIGAEIARQGQVLGVEELLEMPIFAGVSSAFMQRSRGGVVRRTFKKDEIICRQGEFGSTAFYIEQGTVDVYLESPMSHVKKQPDSGLFKKMKSMLAPRAADHRADESDQRYIPIDSPVDLAYDHPIAELKAGDLFGEMTCLNFYPRSATVRAKEDVVVLEMLRNVLDILRKNRAFRAKMEAGYRKRAMDNHLRSVPVLRNLTPEFLDYLRDRVELIPFSKDEVICRQGDAADAFYLVRIGHVKVSQTYPGGELVLSYLGRGQYFGEMGLLGGGMRTATCTAIDNTEVVRIAKNDFERMLTEFPDIRAQLQAISREREEANRAQAARLQSVSLNEFLSQGLMEAQSLLILDLEKCVRCDECVKACAAAHDGVTRLVRDGLRFDKYLVATSCRQCRDPLCMIGCPVGSIRRKNSLEIVIEDWCIGCGLCAQQCPYGNINMHSFEVKVTDPVSGKTQTVEKRKATGCDLCTSHKTPSCVYACPHDAAHRVDPQEFFDVQLLGARANGQKLTQVETSRNW